MKKILITLLALLVLAGTAFALYEQNPKANLDGNLGSSTLNWLYAFVKYVRIYAGGDVSFDGATADAYRTSIVVVDPTATRTITIPNASGAMPVNCMASHDYGNATDNWTLTSAESACSYLHPTNAKGAVNAKLPAAYEGRIWHVNNGTGQVLTFKVSGGTGGTVAASKTAIYAGSDNDTVEIYEKP